MLFTQKQQEVYDGAANNVHRWSVSQGAVRSGKTHVDYFKIPLRILNAPSGHIFLIGKTLSTLERNVLAPMRNIWGQRYVGYPSPSGKVKLFMRDCWCLGAAQSTQAAKLQGAGIAYCYGDEITTWSEEVFHMLKSRLDKKEARFDGTCNPDNPSHWFHKFLQSDADVCATEFAIDDNPHLDPEFVAALKKEYAGTVYYDRFILGKWRAASGVVYRLFADKPEKYIIKEPPEDIVYCAAGLDFGGNNSAHALNLTGFTKGFKRIVTLDEWYSKEPLTPDALEGRVCDFLQEHMKTYRIGELYCDSAEPVLIRGIKAEAARRGLAVNVKNARKFPVNDRIRFYCRLLGTGKYAVTARCENTIRAFSQAVWEDGVQFDRRLDDGSVNVDSLDAQEYSTESVMSIVG